MKKRSILNSPRLKEIKRKRRNVYRNRIIFFVICFLILFTGLTFVSRISKFNISEVQILGNKIIETKAIEQTVQENLSGYYLWVFPKTNFIIYPKNRIKKDLANKFKRFETILINDKNIKTLEISVTEREGKYTWCGGIVPALVSDTSSLKCYFMDSSGYIFDEAPYFSGNVYFKFYGGDENLNIENPSGSFFMPKYFKQIITLKENLELMNLKPAAFFQSGDESHKGEGFISLVSEPITGPYVTFKLDSDYQKMTENLQAAISTEPLQTELKEKFDSLLYIDLRFGNKVVYKFQ